MKTKVRNLAHLRCIKLLIIKMGLLRLSVGDPIEQFRILVLHRA